MFRLANLRKFGFCHGLHVRLHLQACACADTSRRLPKAPFPLVLDAAVVRHLSHSARNVALFSEGALCTGALCAGAVPAVLFSERSIVFMCARAHKGHIVPLVVFVLAACEHGPRPASWLCSCSRGVRAQATPAY